MLYTIHLLGVCGQREVRVKKTILAYNGVKSAEVSHTLCRAVVELEDGSDTEGLDYKVVSIN